MSAPGLGPRLSPAQIAAAHGKVFDAPRVLDGSGRIRFMGVWPTGNVAVKREADSESFGPVTVSAEQARPLIEAIAQRLNRRGYRAVIDKVPGGAA